VSACWLKVRQERSELELTSRLLCAGQAYSELLSSEHSSPLASESQKEKRDCECTKRVASALEEPEGAQGANWAAGGL